MYKQIIESIKDKPKLYETTGVAFWDDDHISQSMLKVHLDPYTDGASRQHLYIEKSADWISTYLRKDRDRLLDLGCGPGIYAELLWNKGFRVTGIDYSNRSISYAKQSSARKGKNIKYIYQDYLSIGYEAEYDVIILIYCDLGVLPPQERATLLNKIYNALKPGGIFIVDVFSLSNYTCFQDSTTVAYEDKGFWCSEPYVCIQKKAEYEHKDFLEQYVIITENRCQTYNLWNHAFSSDELTSFMRQTGFANVDLYSDVTGTVFEEKSKTICAVCKKS